MHWADATFCLFTINFALWSVAKISVAKSRTCRPYSVGTKDVTFYNISIAKNRPCRPYSIDTNNRTFYDISLHFSILAHWTKASFYNIFVLFTILAYVQYLNDQRLVGRLSIVKFGVRVAVAVTYSYNRGAILNVINSFQLWKRL